MRSTLSGVGTTMGNPSVRRSATSASAAASSSRATHIPCVDVTPLPCFAAGFAENRTHPCSRHSAWLTSLQEPPLPPAPCETQLPGQPRGAAEDERDTGDPERAGQEGGFLAESLGHHHHDRHPCTRKQDAVSSPLPPCTCRSVRTRATPRRIRKHPLHQLRRCRNRHVADELLVVCLELCTGQKLRQRRRHVLEKATESVKRFANSAILAGDAPGLRRGKQYGSIWMPGSACGS